jgi:hypothetical protein
MKREIRIVIVWWWMDEKKAACAAFFMCREVGSASKRLV